MNRGLMVDDDRSFRTIIPALVNNKGFVWETAENGVEALKICFDQRFDIIVCDWHMPEMDGVYFVQHIRHLAGYQQVPIIFFTCDRKFGEIVKTFGDDNNIEWLLKGQGVEPVVKRLKEKIGDIIFNSKV